MSANAIRLALCTRMANAATRDMWRDFWASEARDTAARLLTI